MNIIINIIVFIISFFVGYIVSGVLSFNKNNEEKQILQKDIDKQKNKIKDTNIKLKKLYKKAQEIKNEKKPDNINDLLDEFKSL